MTNRSQPASDPTGHQRQGARPAASKPAVPLEEMVDRARAARGAAAGEGTMSSAAKAPSPTPDAPPRPPDEQSATTADLLESDHPEGATGVQADED